VSRRTIPLSQLTPEQAPALFQSEAGEKYVQDHIMAPPVVTLYADLYVVQYFSDAVAQAALPSTAINNLMDTIEDSLAPVPGLGVQTLGETIQYAWLEGRMLEWFPSSQGRWAVSAMRVALLTNR
jgi:hypothetical protein